MRRTNDELAANQPTRPDLGRTGGDLEETRSSARELLRCSLAATVDRLHNNQPTALTGPAHRPHKTRPLASWNAETTFWLRSGPQKDRRCEDRGTRPPEDAHEDAKRARTPVDAREDAKRARQDRKKTGEKTARKLETSQKDSEVCVQRGVHVRRHTHSHTCGSRQKHTHTHRYSKGALVF